MDSHLYKFRDFSLALLWSLKVDYQNQQMPSGTAMIQATTYNSDFQFLFFFAPSLGGGGLPLLICEFTCAFKIIVAILSRTCRCFELRFVVFVFFFQDILSAILLVMGLKSLFSLHLAFSPITALKLLSQRSNLSTVFHECDFSRPFRTFQRS